MSLVSLVFRSRFLTGGVSLTALSLVALVLAAPAANAQVAATATTTISLAFSNLGSSTAMNVTYDPIRQLYYAAAGGLTNSPIQVYNAAGTLLQTYTPGSSGSDTRALNYNANTNTLEVATYNAVSGGRPAGLITLGRDGQGLLTDSNTTVLSSLPGLNGGQTMPAFDAVRNRFYSRDADNTVNLVSRTNGSLLSTLTLATPSNASLTSEFLGYDSTNNYLVASGTRGGVSSALVYDLTGAFVGSSTLPGAANSGSFNTGYANGQLFVYNSSTSSFQGYKFLAGTNAAAPEPGSIALLLTAGVPVAGLVRRRRKV